MKRLFGLTALIEVGTGVALVATPSGVVELLLGAEISGAALPLGRLAGVALLALGTACWLAREDDASRAARGLAGAMLLYNFGVAVVLGMAGALSQTIGVALWPAVALHVGMAAWCVTLLARKLNGIPDLRY
jgi:hypothetical protein